MKNIFYIMVVVAALSFSACSLEDNYAAPDCTLSGTLIDSTTGQPLRAENSPYGFRIMYTPEATDRYPTPQSYNFYGKADGTFQNTKMFDGNHSVYFYDGAFPQTDAMTVNVGKDSKNLQITVTPYFTVNSSNVSFDSSSKRLTVQYDVRTTSTTALTGKTSYEIGAYVSWNPNVSKNVTVGGTSKTVSIDGLIDASGTLQLDLSSLATGHTWYVRIGVRPQSGSRYNYGDVMTFTY